MKLTVARLAPLLLAAAVAAVWVWAYGKTSVAAWCLPVSYGGDSLETFARIKAAAEGDWLPFQTHLISRLGAPFGANWNTYAEADLPLFAILGWLSHGIGLFATANLALLLAHLGAALAFYGVTRLLHARIEWAFAGAALFACSNYLFVRSFVHFSLVLVWTVPLALLSTWLVAASQRLLSRRRWLVFGTAIALGMGSPYYLFAFLQLMALAIGWQVLGARRRENLMLGAAAIGLALTVFTVINAPQWFVRSQDRQLDPIVRDYRGTEAYALKPLEMIVPPAGHRADWLAMFGRRYDRWSFGRIEGHSSYLGLAGIASLALLGAVALRRAAANRNAQLPAPFWQVLWILLFASIGGLGNMLAFFARLQVFRSTNRFSVFILALALMFAVLWLSRHLRRWPRWVSIMAAAVVLVVGWWDQVPMPRSAAQREEIAAQVRSDQQIGKWLESQLPAGGMVFQLPVLGFPEMRPPGTMRDYDHFRPYLATNQLRFSYGALKNRARIRWQYDLQRMSAPDLVHELEANGFSALYINIPGLGEGARPFLDKLAAAGYPADYGEPTHARTIVRLHPVGQPQLPLARGPTFGRGWVNNVNGPVWPRRSDGSAWLAYYNPLARPLTAQMALTLDGPIPVEVWLNGHRICQVESKAAGRPVPLVHLNLSPGPNKIEMRPMTTVGGTPATSFKLHRLDWKTTTNDL